MILPFDQEVNEASLTWKSVRKHTSTYTSRSLVLTNGTLHPSDFSVKRISRTRTLVLITVYLFRGVNTKWSLAQ